MSGVSDGQYANQGTFNNAFIKKNGDDETIGKLDLNKDAPESGDAIVDTQRNINSFASILGVATNQAKDAVATWLSTTVGLTSSTFMDKIEALVLKFKATTGAGGHSHSGVDGDGAKVSASDLANFNDYWTAYQKVSATSVTGTSKDVTSLMTGKVSGGGSAAEGVLTDISHNRVDLIDPSTRTYFEDAQGQKVYGRITYAASVWTVSFYTNEAGVETAYSFSSSDVDILFREVFKSANRPTISENPTEFGTLDVTADVADATSTGRGVVSTGTQTFGGAKTFNGDLTANAQMKLAELVDSTTAGTAATTVTPTKGILRLTSGSLVSITGIPAPASGNPLLAIINDTGLKVKFLRDAGATVANRILTGTVGDLEVADEASIFLIYANSYWNVIGGSGNGGGGGLAEVADQAVSSGFTIDKSVLRQLAFCHAASGTNVTVTSAPFGSMAGITTAIEVTLMVTDDTSITILEGAGIYDAVVDGVGSTIQIYKNNPAKAVYSPTTQKWHFWRGM